MSPPDFFRASRMAHEGISKIAVCGTGVMGSSWTTLFLAKGYRVVVTDPAPDAEAKLAQFIESEWSRIQEVRIVEGARSDNYDFVRDIRDHLGEVDFVQEVSRGMELPVARC